MTCLRGARLPPPEPTTAIVSVEVVVTMAPVVAVVVHMWCMRCDEVDDDVVDFSSSMSSFQIVLLVLRPMQSLSLGTSSSRHG